VCLLNFSTGFMISHLAHRLLSTSFTLCTVLMTIVFDLCFAILVHAILCQQLQACDNADLQSKTI
jgi:hypothetical protein